MTDQERETLKIKIQESIQETEQKILELKEFTKPIAPENAIGRVSRMDAINNKSINEAALRQAETRIKQLRYALKQSEHSSFGDCSRCGNPIPLPRLLYRPESSRCVHCADR